MPADLNEIIGAGGEPADRAAEPRAPGDYDPPLWLQALTYPAQADRVLIDAVFPNPGVLAAGDLLVGPRAAGGNMSVDVAPGRAVIAGTDMAGQGKYVGHLKNPVNVPLTPAPGGGLSRIDLIHAHIADATVIGGALNAMTVETPITGTAVSSNPVPPAVPASSEPLAYVTVASGTAAITPAMIADARRMIPRPPAYTSPFVSSGFGGYNTDGFGNWFVTLPPGAKVTAAVANGSQQDVPLLMVYNLLGAPIGGNVIMFRAYFFNGSNPTNTNISVQWLATWTY